MENNIEHLINCNKEKYRKFNNIMSLLNQDQNQQENPKQDKFQNVTIHTNSVKTGRNR